MELTVDLVTAEGKIKILKINYENHKKWNTEKRKKWKKVNSASVNLGIKFKQLNIHTRRS